jgi:hypothetical protein
MGIEVLLEEEGDGGASSIMMKIPKKHQPEAAQTICNVEVSLQVQSYHFSQVWSDCESSSSSSYSETETDDGASSILAQEEEEEELDDDDDGILAISTTPYVSSQADKIDNENDASRTHGVSATVPTHPSQHDEGGGENGNTIDDNLATRGRTTSPGIIHQQQQLLRHFPPSSLTVEDIANVVGHSGNNGSISGQTLFDNDDDDDDEEHNHSLGSITSAGSSMLDSIVNWNANHAPKDAKQQQRYSNRQRRQTTRVRGAKSYVQQSISRSSSTTDKSGRPPRRSKNNASNLQQQQQQERQSSREDTSSLPGAFRECDGDRNNGEDEDDDHEEYDYDNNDEESQRGFEAVASSNHHHHDDEHSNLAIIVPLAAELAPQIEELIAERDALRQELEYSRKQRKLQQQQQEAAMVAAAAAAGFSRSSNNTILVESVAIAVPNEPTTTTTIACDGSWCGFKWNKCSAWICGCTIVLTAVVLVLWKSKIL